METGPLAIFHVRHTARHRIAAVQEQHHTIRDLPVVHDLNDSTPIQATGCGHITIMDALGILRIPFLRQSTRCDNTHGMCFVLVHDAMGNVYLYYGPSTQALIDPSRTAPLLFFQ